MKSDSKRELLNNVIWKRTNWTNHHWNEMKIFFLTFILWFIAIMSVRASTVLSSEIEIIRVTFLCVKNRCEQKQSNGTNSSMTHSEWKRCTHSSVHVPLSKEYTKLDTKHFTRLQTMHTWLSRYSVDCFMLCTILQEREGKCFFSDLRLSSHTTYFNIRIISFGDSMFHYFSIASTHKRTMATIFVITLKKITKGKYEKKERLTDY